MANNLTSLMKKGIHSPDRIIPYLKNQFENLKYSVAYRHTQKQKKCIHDFIKQDKFALVILDSCRFDYFQREVGDFLSGELERVYSPATATINYIQTIWDGEYDLTYVTGLSAPTDYAFERKDLNYRPTDHIENFVHVWRLCEQKELGAVPPEAMTEAALQYRKDKMVVHYVQPHAPYIGKYRLRDEEDMEWGESLQDIYEKIGRYNREDKTISDEELRKAYRSNLRRVLSSVRELAEQLDRPVAVTADHGEMLGEEGRYIHGGSQHPHLCELPWFTVDRSVVGTSLSEHSESANHTETDFTPDDVEDQLQNLGYL
jgi:hypothetical protein